MSNNSLILERRARTTMQTSPVDSLWSLRRQGWQLEIELHDYGEYGVEVHVIRSGH